MGGCAKLHLVLLHYTAVGSLHNTSTLPHLLPRRYGRNGIPGSAPELMIVLTRYRPSDFLGTNDSHPQSSTERFQVQTSISLDHCTSPLSNNKRAACVTDPRPSIAHSNNKRQRIASPRNITTTTTYLLPPTTRPPDFRLHVWTTNSKHAIATCIATI